MILQYVYLVCPYLNWSSFKSGFWAFRYLLIVSSSLGTGSLKEGEQRDMHFMSNGTNEARVSYTVRNSLPPLFPILPYTPYYPNSSKVSSGR